MTDPRAWLTSKLSSAVWNRLSLHIRSNERSSRRATWATLEPKCWRKKKKRRKKRMRRKGPLSSNLQKQFRSLKSNLTKTHLSRRMSSINLFKRLMQPRRRCFQLTQQLGLTLTSSKSCLSLRLRVNSKKIQPSLQPVYQHLKLQEMQCKMPSDAWSKRKCMIKFRLSLPKNKRKTMPLRERSRSGLPSVRNISKMRGASSLQRMRFDYRRLMRRASMPRNRLKLSLFKQWLELQLKPIWSSLKKPKHKKHKTSSRSVSPRCSFKASKWHWHNSS